MSSYEIKTDTNLLDIAEILNDVIRHTVRQHNKDAGRVEWRVLIVDQQSMRMVSACTKMQGRKSKPSRVENETEFILHSGSNRFK